jgi:hypothetical protein
MFTVHLIRGMRLAFVEMNTEVTVKSVVADGGSPVRHGIHGCRKEGI